MNKPKRMKKSLGGGLLAAALAFSVALPGAAFAIGGNSSGKDMGANWTIPTTPMTNTVEKDGKEYKVVTTWAMAWSTSGPDFLGINNSSFYGNGGNGNANVTNTEIGATQTLLGIWASEANEVPDAFNWNSFYNLYAKEQSAAGVDLAESDLACTTDSWDSASGVFGPFKYRPEIIWLCNNLSSAQTTGYVDLINNGQYITNLKKTEETVEITPDEWNALPLKKQTNYTPDNAQRPTKYTLVYTPEWASDASESSEFYVDGDESYNPYVIQPVNSSPFTFVDSGYELANLADQVVADTADAEGLASGESLSWKTMNKLPRSTRYSEDAYECALNIERLARGSAYYTLSKINDGTVKRKKVAFVDSIPTEADATHVTIRVYDYIEDIMGAPGSTMHGRASWSPLVVDQLGQDGSLDVYSNVDHYVIDGGASTGTQTGITRPTMTTSRYVATADDLLSCDIVYAAKQTYTVADWREFLSSTATTDEAKAKASTIEVIAGTPYVCNGSNYTMDKMIYGAFSMDCFYPELFPNMENSTFWYNKIYHIKNSALGSAMTWSFGTATLPSDQSLLSSSQANSYAAADTIAKYNAGLAYFNSAKSTDPTISRILSNTAIDGSTSKVDGDKTYVYNYSNFEPSAYWTSGEKTSGEVWNASGKEVQTINVASTSIALNAGSSQSIGATTNGDGALTYESSNEGVAKVDANGNVTAVAAGTATITVYGAATDNYFAARKAVNVAVSAGAQTITASNVTKTFGNAAFTLSAKTSGDGKLSYSSGNTKVATVDASSGKVTIKAAGTAKITITAAKTSTYATASKTITLTVNKAAQPMTVAKATRTVNVKKAKKTVAGATVKKAQGAVAYAISKVSKSKGSFSINKSNGKITVKKGTKKGTYKVTVKATAKGNGNYKAGSKTAVVTIKVK